MRSWRSTARGRRAASWVVPGRRGAVGRAPQGMAAPHGGGFLAADETLDFRLQLLRLAAQAMDVAADRVGLLEGRPVHFLLDALERSLRQAQQLDEIVGAIERAAAGLSVHARSIGTAD